MPLFNTCYHIITPLKNDGFYIEWEYCRKELIALTKKKDLRIVKFNIFLDDPDPNRFQLRKEYLKKDILDLFGVSCPAHGIQAQAPEQFSLILEIGTVRSEGLHIKYKKLDENPYTLIEKNGSKVLFANGLEDTHFIEDTESCSKGAFEKALELLKAEDMTLDHVVRQWNYIGNILRKEDRNGSLLQHYQLFNEVRNSYYSRFRTSGNFPAATGIGANFEGMAMDICALRPSNRLKVTALNSPIQVEPYQYSQEVLVGPATRHKTAPQFERAKILQNEHYSTVFISGTASIVGQKTIGKNDVHQQTNNTINNIESLVSLENLHCHSLFPQEAPVHRQYKYIRVYVKNLKDIPQVRKICTGHFGNIPATYVQSDICREDLLVEIEGELILSIS